MKKVVNLFLIVIMSLLFLVPSVNAQEKVKVYIFEAGGCPYCDAEVEYLEGLSSYGEKFEIVRKELYIDHVKWEEGADYELGSKTAELFNEAGFTDASVSGTPFVVISDLYASASYSTELESVIDEAYEKGDVDVVGCLEKGGDSCMPAKATDGSEIVATVIVIVAIVLLITLVIVSRRNSSYDAEYVYDDVEVESDKELEKAKTNDFNLRDSDFEDPEEVVEEEEFVKVKKVKKTNSTRKTRSRNKK